MVVGILALVLGVGTIIYGYSVLGPKLNRIGEEAQATVDFAERALQVFNMHSKRLNAIDSLQQNTVFALGELDETLEQTGYLSQHAARTLRRSAHTLREVENRTGLVLPDGAFDKNARAMVTTARSLEGLAPMLQTLHKGVGRLGGNLDETAKEVAQLKALLRRADVTFGQAKKQLRETRHAFGTANLPSEITRLIALHGGIYIALALTLLGIAGVWWRLSQLPIR